MPGKMQVKYIQSLYHKKFREQYNVYIGEGPKIIAEYLQCAPHLVETIYATDLWLNENKMVLKNLEAIKVEGVLEHELRKISGLSTPNQVLAILHKPDLSTARDFQGKISMMLDGIQDPGNLGTLIRIADWFGITDVLCSEDCADAYNPKVVQASMGSLVRVAVQEKNLVEWIRVNPSIPVFAAMLAGENLYHCDPLKEGMILIGNESKGIGKELSSLASRRIFIPRRGGAESLNAAVACGIILSHLMEPT